MRTPFKTQTDIAFQKVEPIGGNKQIMVRFEMINIFNNAQFNGPNMTFGSSSFGTHHRHPRLPAHAAADGPVRVLAGGRMPGAVPPGAAPFLVSHLWAEAASRGTLDRPEDAP